MPTKTILSKIEINLMKHISYQELKQWQDSNKDFQLIDVREAIESASYSIGGELIPLTFLIRNPDKIDTSKPIVVYCKRGIRSQLAIQRLSSRLPDADFYNLANGIYALFHG